MSETALKVFYDGSDYYATKTMDEAKAVLKEIVGEKWYDDEDYDWEEVSEEKLDSFKVIDDERKTTCTLREELALFEQNPWNPPVIASENV